MHARATHAARDTSPASAPPRMGPGLGMGPESIHVAPTALRGRRISTRGLRWPACMPRTCDRFRPRSRFLGDHQLKRLTRQKKMNSTGEVLLARMLLCSMGTKRTHTRNVTYATLRNSIQAFLGQGVNVPTTPQVLRSLLPSVISVVARSLHAPQPIRTLHPR
jgi:hypothetical protein